jgi:hypothetical protein
MSRDDFTPRGLSDPESHLDLAGQRQRPQFDAGTGSEPVAPSLNQQDRNVTLNAAVEVDMLRHKLRALENLVERYGMFRPALLLRGSCKHHLRVQLSVLSDLWRVLISLRSRHFFTHPFAFRS